MGKNTYIRFKLSATNGAVSPSARESIRVDQRTHSGNIGGYAIFHDSRYDVASLIDSDWAYPYAQPESVSHSQ